jgi:hypothetical protein
MQIQMNLMMMSEYNNERSVRKYLDIYIQCMIL